VQTRIFIAGALLAFSVNAPAQECGAGELRFAFDNLEVRKAFAIFANHAGLKANIDQSIPYSSRMHFGCTRWEVAAKQLADKYNLNLRIEHGTMHVSKK
jgi:hypothetical protein